MTIPAAIVDQAFQLLLGRAPSASNPPQFQSMHQLRTMLLASSEFRASRMSQKRRIGWPRQQIFVSPAARVVYNPIGKNACTFMKRQMARISGIPQLDYLLPDIHFLTDKANLGLQLSDYSDDEIQTFLTSPDYLRLVLLRDPRERLLSAWVEKFAIGRNVDANIQHTRSIIDPVQRAIGLETPDYDRGITFREFITEVTSVPANRLDPHWIPQSLYMAGVEWDWVFAFEDIDVMVRLLERRSGMELPHIKQNDTGSGQGTFIPGMADLLPGEALARPRADLQSFYDAELTARVMEYFADDFRHIDYARQNRLAD